MDRKDNYQGKKMDVGIYCRLSNEDREDGISNSIENQRNLLTQYAIKEGFNIHDIYMDDGYTGTNFDRPGFKKLLKDIEGGKISIVLTKDMSRLGRDYIQVGHYIEKYFPEQGIRYIAVNDHVDTGEGMIDNEWTPFKAIMNDMYSKDISKKIRSVFDFKRQQGKFIGSFAPYGYKKDPQDKGKLIIDQETAWIVRKIFHMYLRGKGLKNIANRLNEEKIPPPSVYKYKKIKTYNPGRAKIPRWCHSGVKNILTNVTYTGDLAQGKAKKINYKSKKIKRMKMDDWIIVQGTHEAIIPAEEFQIVHNLMNQKNKNFGGAKKSTKLFSGFVYCGDCGNPMTYHKMPKGYYYLICSTYKKYGKNQCSRHSIREEEIEDILMDTFKALINKFADKEKLRLRALKMETEKPTTGTVKDPLRSIVSRIDQIEFILKELYEDKVKGRVGQEQFLTFYDEFNDERNMLIERKKEFLEKAKNKKGENNKGEVFLDGVLQVRNINRPMLTEVIDKIEVFEDKKLKIHYRFKNPR